FTASAADGDTARGTLRELRPDWTVRLGDGDSTVLAGADLLDLRQDGRPPPAPPADGFLLLFNGDRVPAAAPRVDGEHLRFRSPDLEGGKEAELPLAAVSVYWRTAPGAADVPARLLRRLHAAGRPRDAAYLRNGDTLEGLFTSLDDKKVEIE